MTALVVVAHGFRCARGRCAGRAAASAAQGLGAAAGVLYAAGDVATKGAVHGGAWLVLAPSCSPLMELAFGALQLAFQRGSALASAGVNTLMANALPILAGILLFREHLPHGALGVVRIASFLLVVAAAALIGEPHQA